MSKQIIVSRLPRDDRESAWQGLLHPPGPARELDETRRADWVVIGAGFAGLAAARRLSQLRDGEHIVLVDATRVGNGPAGRNSGFMIDVPHELNSTDYAGGAAEDKKQIALNRDAIQFAREAAEEYGLGTAYKLCGKHNGAATDAGARRLEDYAGHLRQLDEPCEQLDAADMKRLTGTEFYRSGLFTPGTAMLQPAAFVRGLAAGLSSRLDVYENSPVIKLDVGPEHIVHCPKGRITTPRVILAVNGHVQSFGYFPGRLMHIYLFASMTRELTDGEVRRLGGEREWHMIPADPMGTTVRRIAENRILVRNGCTYSPGLEATEAQIEAASRAHDRSFHERFPMLGGVDMEYRWGGRLCLSLNGVPAFGEVDEGVYSANCQNGLGAAKGTLSGMAVAELAAGERTKRVEAMLAFAPPRRLPPEPFMSLAAAAKLKWMEWRAGREM